MILKLFKTFSCYWSGIHRNTM